MIYSPCALTGTPQTLIWAESGTLRKAFLSWSEREFDTLSCNKKNRQKGSQIGRNRQIYGVPVRAHGLYFTFKQSSKTKKRIIFYICH
jgi:hypothetical protein